jgi:tRNA(Ile)-lysidine synthetase-like protein
MTAISPYAPPGRTSLLRPALPRRRSSGVEGAVSVGFLLWVIRYWQDTAFLRRLGEGLRNTLPEGLTSQLTHAFRRIFSDRLLLRASPEEAPQEPRASSIGDRDKFPREENDCAERIQQNLRTIQSVLKYWFGQYTPDESQKKLWMIADLSKLLRAKVDSEILDRFGGVLIELSEERLCEEWCHEMYGYQGKLAAIVVLDQFSRHIHRFRISNDSTLTTLAEQPVLDKLALRAAELLMEHHTEEIKSGMIPLPMYIFALMPFRHSSRLESVKYVQQQVETSETILQQYSGMLRRFRKATNRRMAVLQDTAHSAGDANKTDYSDGDILECFPFDADFSVADKQKVHQTIRSFLAERGIHPHGLPRSVIVSLSGGVDSMVIASVLSHLKRCCGYNLELVAVHIDYANRPESGTEAAYVQRYCEQLDIAYRCRCIDEVTRGVTARDAYEKIAREIRYSVYREAVQECRRGTAIEVGVMLGHHRGDLRENVLSNAHKGCGPLDLSGMTAVSQNDGITLYRPLLLLEKTNIYDYAHTFGVPYFKDTTPHWSTRGKLRNQLLPLLEEIYGEGSMNNLSSLAVESDDCRALLHEVALKPFLDQISYKPMGIHFATAPWKKQGLFLWKFVLREALHSAGLGMFSDKSVVAFLERVQAEDLREGWLQCRKDYGVYLRSDGTVFVFYPKSFPWRRAESYSCLGQRVDFDNIVQVGPWQVDVQEVHEEMDTEETTKLLEIRAVSSMEDLMDGIIEYHLEVPTWPIDGKDSFEARPLVFTKFTKATRPRAWKGIDVKLQEALPLAGNDEQCLKALAGDGHESNPVILARVTMYMESSRPNT